MPVQSAIASYEVFELDQIADPTGTLYVADFARRGGGPCSRFFFLSGVPRGERRGGHAHKRQAEYLVCVEGTLDAHIEARGVIEHVALRKGRALFLPGGHWLDLINFSSDAVLAVLVAHPYDESDYIRDRAAFRRWEAVLAA
jgi:mannose-6-phosphate isomerase-like protein (cupin superfamily)